MSEDVVVRGVVLQTDAALRQLSFSQQRDVVDELVRRIQERTEQSGRTQLSREKGCIGKHRYDTREEAQRARVRVSFGNRMEPYECPRCAGWHIGHPRHRR